MRRMVVTGRNGQVAQSILELGARRGFEVLALSRPGFDLAEPATIGPALRALAPDVVVSAAAYTAVDKAESEADLAMRVNRDGPRALAEAAGELGVPILHLSTDYVFDGTKPSPYVEDDPTAPINIYGLTKLAGEQAIAAASPNHVILRTAWVYSPFGANFVKTMLALSGKRDSLRVVADQIGRPTYAPDIAEAIFSVARRLGDDASPELRGVFHLSGADDASWYDFAASILAGSAARGGRPVMVEPIGSADYPTPARRPANSRLDGGKLARAFGVTLPSWRQSLEPCLDRLVAPEPVSLGR